jgi:ankyrin repeat protein
LIETHGGDVNVLNNNNDTPLHRALRNFDPRDGGDIAVLTYLINQKNVNVNIKGWNGYTLLHATCLNINYLPLDVFKCLIETHGGDVDAQDHDRNTPLHCAFRYFNPNKGDINVLTYLLAQKNFNANIKGVRGYTLLHFACLNINYLPLDVFKCLIETHGADVDAQNEDNNIPSHHALLSFSLHHGGDITVLTYLLAQNNINTNIKGKDGYTLLHLACKRINKLPIDIFKVLIETTGADVNVQDNNKDTPLHHAFLHFDSYNDGVIATLTYLLSHQSINFNIKSKNDRNLLHWACINNLSKSRDSAELNVECDTILCQIVEAIAERCLQQILDETTP